MGEPIPCVLVGGPLDGEKRMIQADQDHVIVMCFNPDDSGKYAVAHLMMRCTKHTYRLVPNPDRFTQELRHESSVAC